MLEKKVVSQCISSDYCAGWNDAVDAIPRWISVVERLPEVDKRWMDKDTSNGYEYSADLLVYDGVRLRVAYYCHTTTWWYDSRYEDDIIDVTHWMHLPEPPKEE